MIQELLYTSYEGQGLRKGGGGGFCTVLSTQGMAANMATALERLSGYRHPFDIHDPRAQDNPVNFQHAIIAQGGVKYHVLSRIADLRREHTGRSNKLAHHVAILDGQHLPVGGPSHALSQPGFSRTDWDSKVRIVPAISPNSLPQNDIPSRICTGWQAATGDAGWAGSVADELLGSAQSSVNIIFPQGTDTLRLTNEVFSLVPPDKRWEISFSTYYTSLIPGSSCDLRFFLDGTPESEQLRRDHRQSKIDLCAQLGLPNESALVTAARTGRRQFPAPPLREKDRADRGHFGPSVVKRATDEKLAASPTADPQHPFGDNDEIGLEPPATRPKSRRTPNGYSSPREMINTYSRNRESEKSSAKLKVVLVGLAAAVTILLLIVVGGGVYIVAQSMRSSNTQMSESPITQDDGVKEPIEKEENNKVVKEPSPASTSDQKPSKDKSKEPTSNEAIAAITTSSGNGTASADVQKVPVSAPPERQPPENGLQKLSEAIPQLGERDLDDLRGSRTHQTLSQALVNRDLPQPVTFTGLVGCQEINVDGGIGPSKPIIGPGKDQSKSKIPVTMSWKSGGVSAQSETIAEIAQTPSGISFAWTEKAFQKAAAGSAERRALANGLRWCQILVKSEDREFVLPLSNSVNAIRQRIAPPEVTTIVGLTDTTLPRDDAWKVTSHLLHFTPGNAIRPGEFALEQNGKSGKLMISYFDGATTIGILEAGYQVGRNPVDGKLTTSAWCKVLLPEQDPNNQKWWSIPEHTWGDVTAEIGKRASNATNQRNESNNKISGLNEAFAKASKKEKADAQRKLEDKRHEFESWDKLSKLCDAEKSLLSVLTESPLECELSIATRYKDGSRELPPVQIAGHVEF